MEELVLGDLKIVCEAAAPHDRSRAAGPINPAFDQSLVNVNAHGLPQHKPLFERFVGFAFEPDDLGDQAFELNGAGGYAGRRNHVRRRLLEAGQNELIDLGSHISGTGVHRFGELAGELLSSDVTGAAALEALGAEFRTPGHIPVCRESPGGLETRQGHTELAVAIARLAGQVPATIGAEMLEPDGDGALSVEDGREYAAKHSIPMITGADLLSALGIEE